MAGLFALAVIPSAVILLYVWRKDRIEKEPVKLLLKLCKALLGFLLLYLERIQFRGNAAAAAGEKIFELTPACPPKDIEENKQVGSARHEVDSRGSRIER